MIGRSGRGKNVSRLRGMDSERNFLATLEPPTENVGHKNLKEKPQEWSRVLKFLLKD